MPVKEKRLLSPRYIWRIFTYTYNISLLILAFSICQSLYELSDLEVLRQYYLELTGEMAFFVKDTAWNAKAAAAAALLVFLVILFTLRRLVSNELSAREDTERLMFAVGYRKKDIVLYEEGYVMFDLCCGYAAAVVITLAFGVIMKYADYFSVMCHVFGRWNCMTWQAYMATAFTIVIFIGIHTALSGPFGLGGGPRRHKKQVRKKDRKKD